MNVNLSLLCTPFVFYTVFFSVLQSLVSHYCFIVQVVSSSDANKLDAILFWMTLSILAYYSHFVFVSSVTMTYHLAFDFSFKYIFSCYCHDDMLGFFFTFFIRLNVNDFNFCLVFIYFTAIMKLISICLRFGDSSTLMPASSRQNDNVKYFGSCGLVSRKHLKLSYCPNIFN